MSDKQSPTCPQCGVALPPDAPGGLCPRCVMALNFGPETVLSEDLSPSASAPLSPEALAPYFPQLELLECLGRGGMGVVYKARQKSLDRFVALKLLAPEREKDPQFAERFAREAQALAALSHPHIVTVHDFGQSDGFFYLLMEFVDGVNLRQLLRAKKLTPEEALAIVPPICEALQFAHNRGIVHRDIKPENLLLDKSGRVKIADFGIAKMLGAEAVVQEEKVAGTPEYMAPEQRTAPQTADHRADIYSMGVVLYEMLTGERPAKKIEPPSRKVQIDVKLDEIVLRALESAPERRYHSAAELGSDVETFTTHGQSVGASAAIASEDESPQPDILTFLGIRSRTAIILGRLAALGFLGFLGTVPHGERLWGFSGFFGFLGVAVLVELYSRLSSPKRRILAQAVLFSALVLFVCFALPRRTVIHGEGLTAVTMAFGVIKPWMKEVNTYGFQRQIWSELDPDSFSLAAGVLSITLLMTLGAMQEAEKTAAKDPGRLLLRLRVQGGMNPIRWRNVLMAGLIISAAYINGALLFCALMQAIFGAAPSILLTIAFTVPLSLVTVFSALRKSAEMSNVGHEGMPASHPEASQSERKQRSGIRWGRVALVLLGIPLLIFALMVSVYFLRRSSVQVPPIVEVSGFNHSLAHFGSREHSVFLAQDKDHVHFALIYAGAFGTSSSSGSARRGASKWYDEADITLMNGRTFGLSRESWKPEFLKINGKEYDLRKGRVFNCLDNGYVEQLPLFPKPILSNDDVPQLVQEIAAVKKPESDPQSPSTKAQPSYPPPPALEDAVSH